MSAGPASASTWCAGDLALKHRAMADAAFPFLRATFYRWVGLWREACPDLAAAPKLLAVGDLHVENFGTWRDAEGRLAWGINDFDEAFPMPYTIDLVRLAASALLAIRANALTIAPDAACDAILGAYRAAIAAGAAHGFVLEEEHPALRAMALGVERDPVRFWAEVRANARQQIRRARCASCCCATCRRRTRRCAWWRASPGSAASGGRAMWPMARSRAGSSRARPRRCCRRPMAGR